MTIESGSYISDFNTALPGASDQKSEGDDHIRLIKNFTKATFPNVTGPVTATQAALNAAASGAFTTAISSTGAVSGTSVAATGALSGATLATSGNAAIGGALTVTGASTMNGSVALGDSALDIISVVGAASFAELSTCAKGLTAGNSAQASPIVLDWYEEGSFTPAITIGGGSTGITHTLQSGAYTRIGRTVQFWLRALLSSKGALTGAVNVGGLPYAPVDNMIMAGAATGMSGLTGPPVFTTNTGVTSIGLSWISTTANGARTGMVETNLTNTSDILISGVYQV